MRTAEARRTLEEAVDKALDNKVKSLAVRQQREAMARAHQAELRRQRLAQRAETLAARMQEKAAAEAAMSPAEKAEKLERHAASKLRLARNLMELGHTEKAREWLQEIVQEYPGTEAAREVSLMIAGQ